MKDSKYYKKMCSKKQMNENNNKIWLSKLLISIIIVLTSLIVTNFNSDIKNIYISNVLEANISFSGLNKIYKKYVGNFFESDSQDDMLVANTNDINTVEKLEDGSYKINILKDEPVSFMESGIIVYIGEKGELGNTIIVQGNDGIDIWYSDVYLSDYSLYDYVKKGETLGVVENDSLRLTIMKDGQRLEYDEYFK